MSTLIRTSATLILGALIAVLLAWRSEPERLEQALPEEMPRADEETLRADTAQSRGPAAIGGDAPAPPVGAPPLEEPSGNEEQAGAEPCKQMAQLAATSLGEIGFAPNVEVNEGCAMMVRLLSDASMPALPDLYGFDIPDFSERQPAKRLANEPDNPAWARAMEGRILDEMQFLLELPVFTVHAVCRSSMCGVLFAYTNDAHHGGNYNYYAEELADRLGFSGYHGGHTRRRDGTGFTSIYLGNWRTPRSDSAVSVDPL